MRSARFVDPRTSGPIPSLDGIRAVAVSLVFFAHAGFERVVPGGLGVTVFFVLSGYLITTLMRIEHSRSGRIAFRAFYLRRLLRLMPPLLIVVGASAALAAASVIDGGFTIMGLLSALFYFGNYHVIAHDFHGMPAGIAVVWSLAIEEHYYLLFPPLAAWLLRRARVAWSVGVLAALCAAVLAWRCWLVAHGASAQYLTMATDTRVDAILVGCLLAMAHNPWLDRAAAPNVQGDWMIGIVSLVVLLGSLAWRDEVFRVTARYTLQSLAIAGLIHLAVARANQMPFRWLNAAPVVYLGTISYTVYLSHHVILLAVTKHWPEGSALGWLAASAVLTLLVAEPMRRWVERPCARLRERLHHARVVHPAPPGRFSVGTS